jgi:glucose-6-phosphate 1-dehydrogenase
MVSEIEIIATEILDIQGRGIFYEQTGALCDFIQGHLMELLLLTICDLDGDILKARADAIKNLSLIRAIRGQYDGYKEEVANHTSNVETYASVELNSNVYSLKNIRIKLTTGKALSHKESSIKIYFNDGSYTKIMITPAMPMPNDFISKKECFDGYKGVFYCAINSNKIPFSTNVEILTS